MGVSLLIASMSELNGSEEQHVGHLIRKNEGVKYLSRRTEE